MKLHLPKMLLTAVLAACVANTTAWGGSWSGDSYTFTGIEDATTIDGTQSDHTGANGMFLRAGAEGVTATVTEVKQTASSALTISGTWSSTQYYFKTLTIDSLVIGDGTGSATLNVGTSLQNEAGTTDSNVTIKSISGTISTLNVGQAGKLTLGAGLNETKDNQVTFNVGADNNQGIKTTGELVVASNATLQFAGYDAIAHGTSGQTITLDGGTWEANDTRQSLGSNFTINLINGTIQNTTGRDGGDNGSKYGVIDIAASGAKIVSSGTSSITGGIRLRDSDLTIEVAQDGTLSVDSFHKQGTTTGGIVKQGNGTLKITTMAANSAGEAFYTGNTSIEAGTIEYALTSGTGEYKGTISGTGNIAKSGAGTVTLASISNLDGDISVTGGTLNITSLSTDKTMDVTVSGGALNIEAVVLNPDTMALTAKEGASTVQYYSMDGGSTQNNDGNGFLYTSGEYVLFNGYAWDGPLSSGLTVSNDGTNTYVSTAGIAGTTYYLTSVTADINAQEIGADIYAVQGGTMNIVGTMNGSDIQYTSGSVTLANADSVLVLDSADNAADLLSVTTGESGTIKLTADATMSSAAQAKGKFVVEGSTLTINLARDTDHSYLSSFTSIDLDDAIICYHGSNTTLNDVTVGSSGATLCIKDMGSGRVVSLANTTTLNGDFTIESSWSGAQTWKYSVNIAALTGSGNLTIKGTTTSDGEENCLNAKLLDTYTGTITAEQSTSKTSETKVYLTAEGDVNLTGLNINGGALVDLSGVVGTKNLGAVVIDGSSSLELSGTIGSMATSGDGALSLAAGTSTSGTVSIANALTIGGTIANTGSFSLSGNVTVADINTLNKDAIYSDNDGKDGYLKSGKFYVVESSNAGSASVSEGLKVNDTYVISASDGSLVFEVENDTAGGVYYVNTQDFVVDGASDNAAIDATGYYVATGKTLTISGDQSESMTASTILTETKGSGNITVGTNISLDDVSTQATGKLTINEGVRLNVGNGKNDTSSISSFNAVELKGGILDINGSGKEIKSLTVSTAKSTLSLRNYSASHQEYTLSGTTTLNADLDINPYDDEHGDVIIKELTGSGNLKVMNGGWGQVVAKIEKLTNYSGKVSVDSEGRTEKINYVEFGTSSGPAAFDSLNSLEITGNAYATVYAKGESTIQNLTLDNGTLNVLNLKTNSTDNDGHQTTKITSLSIKESGTLGTTRSSSCFHGTINVESLSNTGDSAVLTLMNGSQCDATTTINLNGGSLKGTINVQSNAVAGSTQTRKLQVNINSKELAKDAVINFQEATTGNTTGDTDLLENNKLGNYNRLGVGTDTVQVAGLTGETARAATITSTDSSKTRTLEIIAAEGADYSTNAAVEASVNLAKSGAGTQTFTSSSIASKSISVNGGVLALTGLNELQLQDLVVKSGATLSVGSAVATVDTDSGSQSTPSTRVSGSATLEGGAIVSSSLDLSSATSLTLNGITADSRVNIAGDLTLPGSGTTLTLSGDILNSIANLGVDDQLGIFSVGGGFFVGNSSFSDVATDGMLALSEVFSNGSTEVNINFDEYYLGFNQEGGNLVYVGKMIPEPTTATLSLLALAALAARRRRR